MVIRLNGKEIRLPADLQQVENADLRDFLYEWHDECPYVIGRTSGSTGIPKEIRLSKADMRASARITNAFFGINRASVLLLCLSTSYIAGKMMVVRALEAGAQLMVGKIAALPLSEMEGIKGRKDKKIKGQREKETKERRGIENMRNEGMERGEHREAGQKVKWRIDLAAMVPMQVEASLGDQYEKEKMSGIRQLLIGGAPVSPELEKHLRDIPTICYATYGMTETVSHVALRKITEETEYFALGEVTFSTDERGCLIIEAPHLQAAQFITNDLVKLSDSRHFRWLGRYDNVINSGGIKFSPEVIEHKISACFSGRFFITSCPDERLGQRIVLVVEDKLPSSPDLLIQNLRQLLSAYEMPREIFCCPHFRETSSGKVIRNLVEASRVFPNDGGKK